MELYQGHACCHMTKFSLLKQLGLSEPQSDVSLLMGFIQAATQDLSAFRQTLHRKVRQLCHSEWSSRLPSGPEGEATTL